MSNLTFKKDEIEYLLKVSKRAARMRIVVVRDGSVTVTVPGNTNPRTVEKFLTEKIGWIRRALDKFRPFRKIERKRKNSKAEYKKNKERALNIVKERVEFFNKTYAFAYNKISIRNQKTRWGSCSRSGNLSFNHKIADLSPEVADYIIVHELCHLGEFNHSKKFWALVEKTIPNYKTLRKKLRNVD